MRPFPAFPVWVFLHDERPAEDGYQSWVLRRGGPPTPFPETLLVFSTEARANDVAESPGVDHDPSFKATPVDSVTFIRILEECRDVEDVALDIGSDEAEEYRIESLLLTLKP